MASGVVPGKNVRGYPYEISGGHLALDFANTVDARRSDAPIELLTAWDNLTGWSVRSRAITAAVEKHLLREGAHRPEETAAVLRRARFLREALFALFAALAGGRPAPRESFAVLNDALSLLGRRRLVASDGFDWTWQHPDEALDVMLPPVIAAAADLLRTPSLLDRIRVCASVDRCAWLFLDTSRNGTRRWCDMTVCGNRAKAKRHYARVAGGAN